VAQSESCPSYLATRFPVVLPRLQPLDLHSPKAPRILHPEGVTLGGRRAPLYGRWIRFGTGLPTGTPWWSMRGTAWPATSPAATRVPDGFVSGSHRVPAIAHVSVTGHPSSGGRIPLAQARRGTGRNSRGTEWGLSRNRDPSGSSRMGTEWGLGPFTIEQTTEDVTAIHRLAASRLRRATASSPPAAGSGTERRSAAKAGATIRDASRTSDQDGPEPGHLTRRRARSERRPVRALGRRAIGSGAPARTAESAKDALRRMAEARLAGGLRTRAERREGR
jgi:hypothetical protein